MNRNWGNQKQNPALKTKMGNIYKIQIDKSQPSGQLFPKMWPLSNPNRTKSIMNKH